MADQQYIVVRQKPRKRRGAVKKKTVHTVLGHEFQARFFRTPAHCAQCKETIWGLKKNAGYQCLSCLFAVHERCHEDVSFPCPGQHSMDTIPEEAQNPHKFSVKSYNSPTFCDHCGGMLYGLLRQGHQCSACEMNVHKSCIARVPALCGKDHHEKRGRILLSFHFEEGETANTGTLSIVVKEAQNVVSMDPNGMSDPYVKIKLTPDSAGNGKRKTNICKKTLNPVWNERIVLNIGDDDYENGKLSIQMWDWDRVTANDFMGTMAFTVKEVRELQKEDKPVERWYKLLNDKEGEVYNVPILTSAEVDEKRKSRLSIGQPFQSASPRLSRKSIAEGMKPTLDDFQILQVLGKGSFGKVVLAEFKYTDQVYAIKILKKDVIIKEDDIDCTMTERNILAQREKSPFLTALHSSFQTKERLYLVMEFVSGGDLMFHISEKGRFDEPTVVFFSAEVCLALWHLHKHGIYYRDLKLDNIMLDKDGHIKLTDFGMCKDQMKLGEKTHTFCGTPEYMAPEIVGIQEYDQGVDWWALGAVIYELLCGQPPFEGEDEDEITEKILEADVIFPKSMSREAQSVCSQFLKKNPMERLGCGAEGTDHIKFHPFYRSVDWEKMAGRDVEPVFKPVRKSNKSTNNFDSCFNSGVVKNTPTDMTLIQQLKQTEFQGFTYVNLDYFADDEADGDVTVVPMLTRPNTSSKSSRTSTASSSSLTAIGENNAFESPSAENES